MLSEQELTRLSDDRFCPVFLRAATAYGASPKLRFDLVLNNLTAWALTTGRVKLKSDGSAWRPLVHVEDLGRAFVSALEAPGDSVNCRAFNVGQTNENYRVSEVAQLVEEAVSGSRVELSHQVEADRRCYRVRCDRIAKELPHFRPVWTVKSGIEQLLDVLRRQPLSSEDFEGSRFDRKTHLLQLLDRGIFDRGLRRKSAVP
jgi:nucleoside-diphosphate-sugar epimerase